jgi:glc operon protein GlcG
MITRFPVIFGAALAAAILLHAPASARQALTFEEARTAMDAAEAEARANGWNVTVIVADAAGVPLYLRRFGGAMPRSYEIATAKILTVLRSGMSTGEYAAALAAGQIERIEGAVTFEGGYLIRRNGEVIGAMSASGVRGSQDAQIVRAGLSAIGLAPQPASPPGDVSGR